MEIIKDIVIQSIDESKYLTKAINVLDMASQMGVEHYKYTPEQVREHAQELLYEIEQYRRNRKYSLLKKFKEEE